MPGVITKEDLSENRGLKPGPFQEAATVFGDPLAITFEGQSPDHSARIFSLLKPKLSGFCWPVISQFIQHKNRHILEISKVICKQ